MSSIVLFDVPSDSGSKICKKSLEASGAKDSMGLSITRFMVREMDGKYSSPVAHYLTTNNQVLPCEE
jgi:hypothetical protein